MEEEGEKILKHSLNNLVGIYGFDCRGLALGKMVCEMGEEALILQTRRFLNQHSKPRMYRGESHSNLLQRGKHYKLDGHISKFTVKALIRTPEATEKVANTAG